VTLNEQYLVDVIGFNPVERSMLASIFALAARRDPGFAQYDPGTAGRQPDIYLVDADDRAALKEFSSLHRRSPLPAVLVGASAHGAAFPVLPRPLQWARLLQALDDTLAGAEEPPISTAAPAMEPAQALRRTLTGGSRSHPGASLSRSNPPRDAPDPAAKKRMLGDAVLVVDDNATVRMFMQAKLAPFGFEVDIAETGEEAIGMSGNQEYTCVFLDVVLPGIDGYQVCKLIKSNKQAIK